MSGASQSSSKDLPNRVCVLDSGSVLSTDKSGSPVGVRNVTDERTIIFVQGDCSHDF